MSNPYLAHVHESATQPSLSHQRRRRLGQFGYPLQNQRNRQQQQQQQQQQSWELSGSNNQEIGSRQDRRWHPYPDPNPNPYPTPYPDGAQTTAPHQQHRKAPAIDEETTAPFPFGNYSSYYGYRSGSERLDRRLQCMDAEWFRHKRVLDIGCNAGSVTVAIGMLFSPVWIEGVDIDPLLIRKARAYAAFRSSACNIVSLCNTLESTSDRGGSISHGTDDGYYDFDYFPASCAQIFGPLPIIQHQDEAGDAANGDGEETVTLSDPLFPGNIHFRCGDWVHEPPPRSSSDYYDAILALSITKWIHLNWGDSGIKHFFRKCFNSLHSGGRLILEPQPFETYLKKSNVSNAMRRMHAKIRFTPDKFADYLTSKDIGFSSVSVLDAGTGSHGFARPIYVFTK